MSIQNFNSILQSFNINAECVNFDSKNNYFFYDLKLNSKTRIKDIEKYENEISLYLNSSGKPRIKPLYDQGLVRLEFINQDRSVLNLIDLFISENICDGQLPCILGKKVDGKNIYMDLTQNPHMLIAGTTGSGKSILLHNIIANLLHYSNVDLFLIDSKRIEFISYENNPFIYVGYSYNRANAILDYLINLMEERYLILRNKSSYDMKNCVLIIDEFSDLILLDSDNEFYKKLCKLSQKCRAAKINIILSTQRPSVDVISGTIKANFPARICCQTASKIDSRIVLDCVGAENLSGKGDALIKSNMYNMERFQIAHITAEEVFVR